MPQSTFVLPVLPGKANAAALVAQEFQARPREFEASRRRAGISFERSYRQTAPFGDFVITYIEHEGDLPTLARLLTESDLPIDEFAARTMQEAHGGGLMELVRGGSPETIAVWTNPHVGERGKGLAFCAPLLPDAEEKARSAFAQEVTWKEFGQSRRAKDQHLEVIGLQPLPQGPLGTFYVEGDDPRKAIQDFASSRRPYETRLKGLLARMFEPVGDVARALDGIEEIFDSEQVANLAADEAKPREP